MKYKRLYLDSPSIPPREKGNAGFDISAYGEYVIRQDEIKSIDTGIAVAIPERWVGLLLGRSGLRFKFNVNGFGVGVIDENYRGEIKLLVENRGNVPLVVNTGDRICQMIIVPYYDEEAEEVKELSDSNRGLNGFGSTGVKELLQWE